MTSLPFVPLCDTDFGQAVDPMRWNPFQPAESDIISPLAVHTLLDFYNAVNIIGNFHPVLPAHLNP